MKIRIILAILFSISGSALSQDLPTALRGQVNAIAAEKAARTPAQRKLNSQLLYLSREVKGQKAVAGAPELKSRTKRERDGRVVVDISAAPSADLSQAITDAGGAVLYESPRWSSVRASVPPSALLGLAKRADVQHIRKGTDPIPHTGSVTNEANVAHRANVARVDFGVDGTGIKVGVISDSVDYYTNSIASGDLPASFTVLPGRTGIEAGSTGEGTAMSEIVHDIAPGADLYFASASGGKAFFADSILLLRSNGCHIIVDDISYGNEWQFQDDEIGQAVNSVVADGALYLSSSGNEGSLKRGNSTTWEGDFVDGGESQAILPLGRIHSFGAQNYNHFTNGTSTASLQWSDEYNTSTNDYDLFILNAAGTAIVSVSADTQDGNDAPYEFIDTVNAGERIVIFKSLTAAPRYLRISCTGSPLVIATAGQTIGHASTPNCICVASSDASAVAPGSFTTNSVLDDASSDGPRKMFYLPDGTPITPGNFLASGGLTVPTPSITAGDGGVTSVPGFEQFYGTSAAAPAAAALAALVLNKRPSLLNSELRTLLETSTLDIEDPGFDVNSGNGIVMPELALAQILTPQEVWRKEKFNTYLPTGDASPTADPDMDQQDNLYEYATGGDPNVMSPSPVSMVAHTGTTFSIHYRRNTAATDTMLSFESNTNLLVDAWGPVAPTNDTLVSTAGDIELRDAKMAVGTSSTDNFRIRVTETP